MRFYGAIGFVETVDSGNGIWTEQITERNYYGDVTRDTRSLESSSELNDNFTISNQFSIVADDYCYKHFQYIRYVEYLGVKWKVTSVDPLNPPRLIISVKGVYNAPEEAEE